MRVVIAGGGTAGHIEPALATADALRRRRPDVSIVVIGTERGLESRLVPARGYPLELIPPVPLPRRLTPALATVPARLVRAVRAAGRVLDRPRADVVVGFGGYAALPAYLAARRRRVPIVVHEANVRPGLANRVGARLTRHVATAAAGARLPHATFVGMPLRRPIATLDRSTGRDAARLTLGLALGAPVLLVFGGSQGARRVNEAVVGAAAGLAGAGVQVLHLTGAAHAASTEAAIAGRPPIPRYVVLPYLDRMELAYAAADLALCRGGAMTCAELAAVGLPAAYVPLPIGNGEQRRNAEPVVAAGGGLLVDDARLDATWITETLLPLLTDPGRLAGMSSAAARFGRRDGDEALADLVLSAGTHQ
ncbi:MAG TPA: undecaprenyldiphospho-muramoylpentapeptide beta-N-acetylglucosaminyltransferase [Mycobacteriales bacterium]|nr:undecaprenyldiphospho-muramoylpentapeptide beta-N-acetylglucosaminyltransferase [Mycobacteriales bacterium]